MSGSDIVLRGTVVPALEFSDEQRRMIRVSYANGASDHEFEVLMAIASARRLNPLLKQVYFVKRWDSQKRCDVWTTQVSIDGLRAIADRTGLYAGQDEPEWLEGEDGTIRLCKVRVYRRGWDRPVVGVAYWSEYAQKTRDGQLTAFWRDKPRLMIAKVAESLALRKAFPEDISGLYAPEEFGHAEAEIEAPALPAAPRRELPATTRGEDPAPQQTLDDAASALVPSQPGAPPDSSLTPEAAGSIYIEHWEGQTQDERIGAWKHLAARCGGAATLERAVGAILEGYVQKANSMDELRVVGRMGDLMLKGGTPPRKAFSATYKARLAKLETPPEDPGPKGGKPAPASEADAEAAAERAGIVEEGNGAGAQASTEALPMAVINEVKACNGPDHVARHFAAHVGDLAEGLRPRYRAWCEQYLGGRYAKHVAKKPGGAAGMLADAVAKRAAKLAEEADAAAEAQKTEAAA